jgi:hypothetical protein
MILVDDSLSRCFYKLNYGINQLIPIIIFKLNAQNMLYTTPMQAIRPAVAIAADVGASAIDPARTINHDSDGGCRHDSQEFSLGGLLAARDTCPQRDVFILCHIRVSLLKSMANITFRLKLSPITSDDGES